jgi:hypothetical protein
MVGGIDVLLPGPIRDLRRGLSLPAGQVHLDGRRSLQLVRARNVEELRSGRWVVVSTGDIDRISRQQRLLSALLDQMSHAGPLTLLRITRGLAAGTQVDDRLESRDMIHAAEAFTARTPDREASFCILPTQRQIPDPIAMSPFPPEHDGSAVFRLADPATASRAIAWFRAPRERGTAGVALCPRTGE